ncbi:ABC transporter substrate-binding protein [Polyangium mundeleinium]|uniref:Substrate-binding domain-containing protein n=1 Tax=Polyangium mundeleinium TaxID=2995306 RepID=A0ABT5EWH6_9BACT|nr:substrate-binding domain-containing protein [Polyangium mundeleinium]MDC0746162.1 substrate-binding domain-containing protein [Polyangium mundeleinium]
MFGRTLRFALTLVAALLLLSCNRSKEGGATKIAVIPKGTTHEFWKAVHAGAVKASREIGVEIVWKGPLAEDDLKGQIDVVQSFVAQGVSGIVLAPLNDKALEKPVEGAVKANIPVVIFDSDLAGSAHKSFVATDNLAAGRLAGEKLAALLGQKGKIAVLRYQEGSASTQKREEGFLEAIRKMPEIKIVSDNQYGGATTESAFEKAESLLAAQNAGSGGVDGVFCPNESTTFGMLLALRKAGLAGKIKFVGFDASEKLVGALRDGHVDALVVQDPFKIGYEAVRVMAEVLAGKPVAPRIDTGAVVVDKASLDKPETKAIVAPDLAPWLGK